MFNHLGSERPELWLAKLMLLGAEFLFAFYNFALAVRYYNHTSFMINVTLDGTQGTGVANVTSMLNRGGPHYTLGMRGYYLALPLALWLFGPLWLLAGSVFLVALLYRLDRGVQLPAQHDV